MNRRLFLGLIGGTIAAAATPAEFFALVGDVAPTVVPEPFRLVQDIIFSAGEDGFYTIRRVQGDVALLGVQLRAGGSYRWLAPPGWEFVLQPNEPGLVIDGPRVDHWWMGWKEHKPDGTHVYGSGSDYSDPIPLTVNDVPLEQWHPARDEDVFEDED